MSKESEIIRFNIELYKLLSELEHDGVVNIKVFKKEWEKFCDSYE